MLRASFEAVATRESRVDVLVFTNSSESGLELVSFRIAVVPRYERHLLKAIIPVGKEWLET